MAKRMAAVQLSLKFNGDYVAAGDVLLQQFPNKKQGPKHWAAYCHKYHHKFIEQGNVHDAPRSGRAPIITQEEAQEAVRLMATDKYWSVLHAAEHEDYIEALLQRGVSPSHLLRSMRKAEPLLFKHHHIKWYQVVPPAVSGADEGAPAKSTKVRIVAWQCNQQCHLPGRRKHLHVSQDCQGVGAQGAEAP